LKSLAQEPQVVEDVEVHEVVVALVVVVEVDTVVVVVDMTVDQEEVAAMAVVVEDSEDHEMEDHDPDTTTMVQVQEDVEVVVVSHLEEDQGVIIPHHGIGHVPQSEEVAVAAMEEEETMTTINSPFSQFTIPVV
jgi:hypothetical protein